MEWENKVWGTTRCTMHTPIYSRHELCLSEGGFCSYHYHNRRINTFTVLEGAVRIVSTIGLHDFIVVLRAGQHCSVPSKVAHQFHVIETGRMIEEYQPDRYGDKCEIEDIVRFTQGGLADFDITNGNIGVILNHRHFQHARTP